MRASEKTTPEGLNRPLDHWKYADPGLPCDLCGAPMFENRTSERCTHCRHMLAQLLDEKRPSLLSQFNAAVYA